ncbi:carbonic anhydrase [Natronomonas sp.]|uniref:carbonic anhydrase n=1 Tax=Natronomonas sp. TaxID=2184060 RepID=UPI00262C0957|nr:carbonic anhydrase [Natronomonas sp.]
MPKTTLVELFERNLRHTDSLSDDYFDGVEAGQEPAVVSVCCSDSRVPQGGMWAVDTPGWLFAAGNIGNQVSDVHEGDRVLSGDIAYPIRYTDTDVAVVVGHTGCGAVTATLGAVRGDTAEDRPPGVQARIDSLRPIVAAGLEDPRVSADGEVGLVDRLVEYNVDRQVEYLRTDDAVPASVTVLGVVYDFQTVYDDVRGRCHLVNRGGETSVERLREAVPERFESHVNRLLGPA